MIRNIFQKMAAAGMMLLPAWMSLATPVTREQACTAAGNWLKTDPGLGCRLGQSVASARTCTTTNGASFHVVRFAGGGFVVMSADTSQHPVLAFSDSSDLVESADNPLWCIVRADISRRAAATAGASRIAKGRRASSASDASAKWSRLLAPTPKSRAGNGLPTVSDLRVGEILGTKWGQTVNSIYNNYGELCYNMFTPSNYPCGCVATAMGQIMLHHRHPERPKVVARPCRVAGEPVTLSVRGNPYDWTNMKRIPEADSLVSWYDGGATAIERSAIGGLTYDCGVAMCMDWGAPVGDFTTDMRQSASFGAFAFEALTNVFGYANARGYWDGNERVSLDVLQQIALPNFDAGLPVMLGIFDHEVVADGYGFSDGTLYVHINMGWSGTDNAWYGLPYIETEEIDYSSDVVRHVTYNIFPSETGELLSGRVLDSNGMPVQGVQVAAALVVGSEVSSTPSATAITDRRGIYFFRLPGGRSYSLTATHDGKSQSTAAIPLPSSANPAIVDMVSGNYSRGGMACGNSWGNDIVLSEVTIAAPPTFNPPSCLFHPSVHVELSCETQGAVIRYTLDGSIPNETSPAYTRAIVVTGDTTIKARTYRDGMYPSYVVTATYVYDKSKDVVAGDFYANPIVLSGREGSYMVEDNGVYTLEEQEPWHSDFEGLSYPQSYSIWCSWQAPGSGMVTFRGYAATQQYIYPSTMAVYVGDTMASARRIAFGAGYNTGVENDYATIVVFAARRGETYHIVNAVMGDEMVAPVNISWSGDLFVPAVTFIANGGTFSDGATVRRVEAMPGNLWGKMPMPAKSGQVFDGFYTALDGGELVTASDEVPNFTTTYYAHWTPRLGLAAASEWPDEFTTDSWCGQGSFSHDGRDALRSGIIYDGQNSYLITRVTGEGTLTFWWAVSCEAGGKDALRFMVDGSQVQMISGEVGWTKVTVPIAGAGRHILKWNYTKNGSVTKGEDFGWVDQVAWSPAPTMPTITFDANGGAFSDGATVRRVEAKPGNLWGKMPMPAKSGQVFDGYYTALDGGEPVTASDEVPTAATTYYAHWTPRLGLAAASEWPGEFTTDSWCGQGSFSHDGRDALRSGIIYDGQNSYLITRVTGEGTLTFWWAVSCEAGGKDALRFMVDGSQVQMISGEVGWTKVTVPITGTGTHILKWNYTKNGAVTKGEDFGWVDQIGWQPK